MVSLDLNIQNNSVAHDPRGTWTVIATEYLPSPYNLEVEEEVQSVTPQHTNRQAGNRPQSVSEVLQEIRGLRQESMRELRKMGQTLSKLEENYKTFAK